MKIPAFFKLLNQKINKYEKAVSNPFGIVHTSVTLIWIENEKPQKENTS